MVYVGYPDVWLIYWTGNVTAYKELCKKYTHTENQSEMHDFYSISWNDLNAHYPPRLRKPQLNLFVL